MLGVWLNVGLVGKRFEEKKKLHFGKQDRLRITFFLSFQKKGIKGIYHLRTLSLTRRPLTHLLLTAPSHSIPKKERYAQKKCPLQNSFAGYSCSFRGCHMVQYHRLFVFSTCGNEEKSNLYFPLFNSLLSNKKQKEKRISLEQFFN